eukprot:TRINITY_DN2840_c0_g1_i3.p1 TRINITY_DN2840_c0_g1~~TRINITY_DN2840_c0_g1_i3.p1  ORF type:complete len:278 (-),score=62.68 TRINITY_DN2840_c0_g1_i3:246-1079(-)
MEDDRAVEWERVGREEEEERKDEGKLKKGTKAKKKDKDKDKEKKEKPKPLATEPIYHHPTKLEDSYKDNVTLEVFPKVIELNVGGQYYCTSIETLRRFPQSMLGLMFSGRYPTAKDMDGKYFIDRDGPAFGVILNFLRTDRVFLGTVEPSLVYAEAEYYRLPLVPEWEVDVEVQTQIPLDLEGEKSIVSLLRKATLSPWYAFAQQTIHDNMPKLVSVLSRGSQQNGSFGASLALYQNEKKKNTLSTSWKTEGPESGEAGPLGGHFSYVLLQWCPGLT